MPLRQLIQIEKQNLESLTAAAIDATLIQPTSNGLNKSILDATIPVRQFLREKGLHDYEFQGQGATKHGEQLDALLIESDRATASRTSLYRPKTKRGDPRIWFSGLPAFAEPDDMLAIMAHDGGLAVVNLTRTDVSRVLDQRIAGPLLELIDELSREANSVADELLEKLRAIAAGGFMKSVMPERADTAIGRTLEHALGISMNSSRAPDYKGIELKSFRRGSRPNRKTLFAQVANWELSKIKSSREILEVFGYQSGKDFKLNCTVSTQSVNSKGLDFKYEEDMGMLNERSIRSEIGVFATWVMADLRAKLAEKHNETFWVGAVAHEQAGHEFFEFRDVMHTRKPILSQFDLLLEQGEITMDHLIKRTEKGRVSEKGPLFKINSRSLGLLFPPSRSYQLS